MWQAALLALAAPIATRVLAALGIGWITYAGFDLLYDQLETAVVTTWAGMPAMALAILSIAGIHTCIGITLGAYAVRVTLLTLSKFGKVAGA